MQNYNSLSLINMFCTEFRIMYYICINKDVEMPSPYGNCEPSEDYVRTKCLAECEANYIISNCSCKDVYMPGKNVIHHHYHHHLF